MKLIEALKQEKELLRKLEDLQGKIRQHSAIASIQEPVYPDQRKKVSEWVQGSQDLVKRILELRVAVQRTNLATRVVVELEDGPVEKTVAEWIHRRRNLADLDEKTWRALTDRNIQEGPARAPTGDQINVKIIRFYDPEQRDEMISLYSSEPFRIDAALEIANAVTDLIE